MAEKLNSYAVTEANSRGRRYIEKPHAYRNAFERDRDRIIHCDAFRRLSGKTQVFGPGLDDNYRSRSSHTLEVSQIGRTIARVLGLNETLTEAICLAHDLGHSPFGHSGESALNSIAAGFGGFEHNRQTLRIVDILEHPYVDFAGLNLMYETRLGLAKHRGPYDRPETREFKEEVPSLEGQAADVADRIAYNCHDLEDALRAGLIALDDVTGLALAFEAADRIGATRIEDTSIRRTRMAKSIMDMLVSDAIETSAAAIELAWIEELGDVYGSGEYLVRLSAHAQQKLEAFETFLMKRVYMHPSLRESQQKVRQWLGDLFEMLREEPGRMPMHYQKLVETNGLERTVIDYIAGMTDAFCIKMLKTTE